jgi:transposase InsO family protein
MQKRGLPRAAMSDNGSAMTAIEISEGLARLGILHQTTLPYSPSLLSGVFRTNCIEVPAA